MITSSENRLWLAVHLLYPNSSQAFDVYQAVVQQCEEALLKDNLAVVFSKLASVFEKIPAISSNLSFYEFEFDQIDQWKIIYKNSQKIQLLIFVGVLIFELKIGEIALNVKLSQDKAQFLFHQTFKKLAQNSSKIKYNDQLNFRKQNDPKISYLYTYENLIEYCLGQLSDEETAKIKMGLDLYPALQITRDEYLKIINQIQNLKVQRSSSLTSKSNTKITLVKSVVAEDQTKENGPFYKNKKILAATFVTLIISVIAVFQYSGISSRFAGSENTVVIQEIEKKPNLEAPQSEIALESLPQDSVPLVAASASQDQVLAAAGSADETKSTVAEEQPVVAAEPKAQEIAEEKVEATNEAKPVGGLYRGSLVVKDLKQVNKNLLTKIISLGAKKAGEVELGWLKSNDLAYYHFTIPEENIEEAKKYFKEVGTLNIKFEPHPRLIPAGNKRFIIEVKEQ